MRVLFLICLTIIITSCSQPINKHITEELSTEELSLINKKDPSFLNFYSTIFENDCYNQFLDDKTEQVLVGEITYNKLYNFYRQITDSSFCHSIQEEAIIGWNQKFGKDEKTFDSILDYWNQQVESKSLDKYVKVEFDHIKKGDYGIYDLFLKITPNKQILRGVTFSFDLVLKQTNTVVVDNMYSYYIGSITKPIVYEVIDVRDKFRNYVEDNNLSNEEIKTNYEIRYHIINVLLDNFRQLDEQVAFDSVPKDIKTYIIAPSSVLKENIIKNNINSNYVLLNNYKDILLQTKIDSISPKCYRFYQYITNCKDQVR